MKSTHLFEQLNGRVVYMDEIKEILEQAKKDNNTDVIYRLSQTLEDCEDEDRVRINIKEYPQQLNAPRHTGDYREALDECGRLRKGWYFKGGKVLRAEKKVDKKINKTKTKNTPKKSVKEIKSQEEKTEGTEKKQPIGLQTKIVFSEMKAKGDVNFVKKINSLFGKEITIEKMFSEFAKDLDSEYEYPHSQTAREVVFKDIRFNFWWDGDVLEINIKEEYVGNWLYTEIKDKEGILIKAIREVFDKERERRKTPKLLTKTKKSEEKTEKTEKKPVFIAKMIQPGEYIFFGENQWAKRQDAYFEAIAQKYNLETKAVRQLNELVTDTIWRKAYSFENETVGSFGWENYRLMLKNNLLKKVGKYVKLTEKGKEIGQLLSSWSQKNPAPKMLKEMYSKRQEIAYYNAEDLEDFKKLNAKEYGVWQVEKFEEKSEKTDTQPKAEEPTTPHEITFYSDYKLGTNRFAITDENGDPLWYGKDFDAPSSQAQGELNAGKKAVWLAGKVREMFDLPSIKLTLNVDAQWLTYQSDPKQKGYELTRLAEKYNVILDVNWVNGEDNPADAYTTKNASGYQKWSDVSTDEFRVLIKQKGGLSAPCEGLTKREISKIAKEETDKVLKMNIWEFSDMPDVLIEEIKTWKIISKSPYSHSYYNDACKSWNYTTEGSLRVSDHWNFVSWGETHCPTNVPVKDMNWILAQYKDGVYHVIKDYGRASKSEMKKREELEGIYSTFIEYQELKEQEENLNKIAKTIKSLGIKIENYKDTKKDKTKLWDDIKNAFIKKKKPQMTIVKGIYKGSGSRAKRVGSEKYYGTLVSLTNEFATIDKNITSKEFSFDNKKIRDLFHNLKYNYLEVFRKHILEKKAGLKGTEANIPTHQENDKDFGLGLPLTDEMKKIIAEAKADGTYLKAPNGKKTNLSDKQWAVVRTKSFKKWFGDWEKTPKKASKIVDENGEPLVVYHGDRKKEKYHYGWNTFFTDNKKYAGNYKGESGDVYETFLNIRNIFDVRDIKAKKIFIDFREEWGHSNPSDFIKTKSGAMDWTDFEFDDLQEFLNENYENEFDGFVMDEGSVPNGKDNIWRGLSLVPFEGNQIKSATDNNGDFDADNNSILASPNYYVPDKPIVKDVLEWAEKNLFGKYIYHKDIGKRIHFSQSGIKKAVYGRRGISKIRLQLVYVAKQIVQSSRLVKIEADKKNRRQISNVYKLNAFHSLNGVEYKIFIVIRETANGTLYYDHEAVTIKKHIGQTGKAENTASTPLRSSNKLIEHKHTKKSSTDQENAQKSGLSAPNPLIIPMNTERPEVELFNIGGDFGQFLGDVECKPIGSVAITLDAPQGAGKTRFLFYAMNQIAGAGYRCLFVSLEEHPMSELFQQKKEKYIDPQNLHLIDTIGELPNGYDDLKDVIDHYDWIFIDSWGKLSETTPVDFDRDFRKKYNGKGLFVIFQRTVNNTMRGGSRFQFDGDIIMKIHKDKDGDFKNNYAYFDKNRYQSTELHLLKFNTYTHKLMIDE